MRRTPATLLSAVILGAFLAAGSATAAHAAFGSPTEVPDCPLGARDFVEYESLLYFWAEVPGDPEDGNPRGIYSFDGTTCTLVNDDPDFGPTEFYEALEFDGLLYLVGYNSESGEGGGPGVAGYSPYSFDGTTFELLLGDGIPERPNEECYDMVVFDSELYCTAYNGSPYPLYSWNGTTWTDHFADGTGDVPVSMISESVLFEGLLYFVAEDGGGVSFYSYDGTTFTLLAEADDDNQGVVVFDDRLFVVQDVGPDAAFFEWDGTDLVQVPGSLFDGINSDFIVFDGYLYFAADNGDDDFLYRFDGSTFERVTGGLDEGSIPNDPDDFVVFDGQLLLTADGEVENSIFAWNGSAFELVSTDPTDMTDPIVYQGLLFFAGEVDGSGEEAPDTFFVLAPAVPEAAPELADTGVDATAFGLGAAALIALLAGITVLARRPAVARR
jgi:hypothetical protein